MHYAAGVHWKTALILRIVSDVSHTHTHGNDENTNRGLAQPKPKATFEQLIEARIDLASAKEQAEYWYKQKDIRSKEVEELQKQLDEENIWSEKMTPDQILDGLRNLCGYVENGSDTKVAIYQDDTTRTWIVSVGMRKFKNYHGESMSQALIEAIEEECKDWPQ